MTPSHRYQTPHSGFAAQAPWSRASSFFLREYPWDDVTLLSDDASTVLHDFRTEDSHRDRWEVLGGDSQLKRNVNYQRERTASNHYLKLLIEKFLEYERTEVLSPYGQTHAGTIRSFILRSGVEDLSEVNVPPSGAMLLAPDGIAHSVAKMDTLCRYLALLRVVDVASTLEGRQRNPRIPKWSGSWQPSRSPALLLLSDIKGVLTKARNALQNVLSPLDDPSNPSTSALLAPPTRIMRELARSMARTKGSCIVNNILLASLHLSWLLAVQGNVDIPEAFSNGTLGWEGLSEADKAHLSQLLAEDDSAYRIRLPLFYALFISPLVLLRTLSVRKQSMKRAHLVTAAIYSGNQKPPVIAMMEKIIFTLVFGIAKGTTSIKEGIESLLEDLPWDCITAMTPDIASWFVLPPGNASSSAFAAMELLPSTNVPMSDPISTPILSVANPTASAIPTPSSAPNSSLASPPSSLDVSDVTSLQAFGEYIQSAAISANIASAFPRGVLAVVALGALGISLEESAIQQILQELPPSRIIDVPPGIPSFQATSGGEGIVAPIAEQALAPAHKPVLGAHPVVSSPPTGSNNESMVAAVVEQARASEELPILGAHPVVSSPPTGSNNESMVTAVVEQARASEELSILGDQPVVRSPTASSGEADPIPSDIERSPTPETEDFSAQIPRSTFNSNSVASPTAAAFMLDIETPSRLGLRSRSSSLSSILTQLTDMDDLEGADETSGLGSRSGSEMDSIDAELADMLTPDIEGDPSAGLGEIPAANRNTAGSITPGVRPEAVAKASIPPGDQAPRRPKRPRLRNRVPKRPVAISEDEDQGKLEAGPPPKKPRVESPPYEQVPAGGMHLKAADMSHVGNTPDTAIVLDQIDDDVLRRLPPRDSANLETSKRDKIHPPGMDKGETFYGPEGETFCWAPLFYNESDADGFVHWVSAIKESYCGTPLRPRHIAEPDRSAFVIQKEADFKGQSIRERQSVWGKPGKLAIVLTECAGGREVGFDKAGLESITGRMDAEIEVQDQSQPLRRGVNISKARSRRTTLQDMLRFSLLPLRDRPIVNALTFPLPPGLRPEQEFPFSSKHIAWLRTLGNHFCFSPYPTSSTRWSLVAFNGALHYFHIDSDGFGTWVEVKTGLKLWVVARPKDGSIPSFQDIDGFLKIFGQGTSPNSDSWIVEAVVLGPNTRLIMAPNTLHAVWTMENSICYGGHFYAVPNLLDTVVGLIHAFIGEDFLTNTQHVESRFLLRRMVHFFHHAFVVQGVSYNTPDGNDVDDAEHLPNLADRDHFAATFALLSFIEMQNILDSRSYVYPEVGRSSVWYDISEVSMSVCDVNAIPHEERLECIYTRGLATELARWIFSRFRLVSHPDTGELQHPDPWADFYWPYLAHFLSAIKAYKKKYPRAALSSLARVQKQIDHCVKGRPELVQALKAIDVKTISSISPPFTVSPVMRQNPLPFFRETVDQLTSSGFRTGDKVYIAAYKEALEFQSERRRSRQSGE